MAEFTVTEGLKPMPAEQALGACVVDIHYNERPERVEAYAREVGETVAALTEFVTSLGVLGVGYSAAASNLDIFRATEGAQVLTVESANGCVAILERWRNIAQVRALFIKPSYLRQHPSEEITPAFVSDVVARVASDGVNFFVLDYYMLNPMAIRGAVLLKDSPWLQTAFKGAPFAHHMKNVLLANNVGGKSDIMYAADTDMDGSLVAIHGHLFMNSTKKTLIGAVRRALRAESARLVLIECVSAKQYEEELLPLLGALVKESQEAPLRKLLVVNLWCPVILNFLVVQELLAQIKFEDECVRAAMPVACWYDVAQPAFDIGSIEQVRAVAAYPITDAEFAAALRVDAMPTMKTRVARCINYLSKGRPTAWAAHPRVRESAPLVIITETNFGDAENLFMLNYREGVIVNVLELPFSYLNAIMVQKLLEIQPDNASLERLLERWLPELPASLRLNGKPIIASMRKAATTGKAQSGAAVWIQSEELVELGRVYQRFANMAALPVDPDADWVAAAAADTVRFAASHVARVARAEEHNAILLLESGVDDEADKRALENVAEEIDRAATTISSVRHLLDPQYMT